MAAPPFKDGGSQEVDVEVSQFYCGSALRIAWVSSATAIRQNSNWDRVWTMPAEQWYFHDCHFYRNYHDYCDYHKFYRCAGLGCVLALQRCQFPSIPVANNYYNYYHYYQLIIMIIIIIIVMLKIK